MGKGWGCVPSKNKAPSSIAVESADDSRAHEVARSAPISVEEDRPQIASSGNATSEVSVSASQPAEKLKIFIVFYSMYGHVESLAKRMKKGVDGVDGSEGILYRVPETLPADVLNMMKAPSKDPSIPEISAAELATADGILFGFPTRFGCMAAQMKAFFDSTGQLWKEQKLAGKPAGFFVSTGTQGGGQETTA